MKADEFYQSRRKEWDTLNKLVERGLASLRKLSTADIEQMASLYRAASSDLALAKRDFPNHQITRALNQLVARTHGLMYQGEALAWNRLKEFVLRGYPRLFRETAIYTLVASLLLTIPALIVGFTIYANPSSATQLLPAAYHDLIPMVQDGELWIDIPVGERPYASSFIMTNNIRVSFLAFASGVSGGLLTVYVLVTNGLGLGGMLGLTSHYGVGMDLANFVIGHGVIELSVIFMAGGSGLMLGWALLHPGLMRRRDALAQAARKSVFLLMGTVPLLVIAGSIEGFISPSETIPTQVKWSVGIISGVLLYAYLFFAGREKRKPEYRWS